MSEEQFHKMSAGRGFIAALDQSGGSTPKALEQYGIDESAYSTSEEMFGLMHAFRSRIMQSASFDGEQVLGAILFEDTMDRQIDGVDSPSYLWEKKRVVPFLKVDRGLAQERDGVQLMNIPPLGSLLSRARDKKVFGTKARSFVKMADPTGIKAIVDQQFALADEILGAKLVPIVEPEVDIRSPEKAEAEALLKQSITEQLDHLGPDEWVILKLSLPEVDDFYANFVGHPNVLRVAALSGGYSQKEADARLARNHGVIASFSRALTEGLSVHQTDEEFDATLKASIAAIYDASVT